MSIVSEWQKPLEEALERMLNESNISYTKAQQIEDALDKLDQNAEGVQLLRRKLKSSYENLENRYKKALQKLESAENSFGVKLAIEELKLFSDYKDASQKIEMGMEKLQRINEAEAMQEKKRQARKKKLKIFAVLAALALIAALIVFFVVRKQNRVERIEEIKTEINTMIDSGKERETEALLKELEYLSAESGVLSECAMRAVKQLSLREGPDAGYEWLEKMENKYSYFNSRDFSSWVQQRIKDTDISVELRWDFVCAYMDFEKPRSTTSNMVSAYNEYLHFMVNSESIADADGWNAWITEMKPYMATMPAKKETALQLAYRMMDAGVDLKTEIPDGILIDLPCASIVSTNKVQDEDLSILDLFFNRYNSEPLRLTDERILPISVIESKTQSLYYSTYYSESKLTEAVAKVQANDDHYTAYLLVGYLADIPEEYRARTFEECNAYLAMEQFYELAGYTYSEEYDSNTYYSPYTAITRTYNYRGHYFSIDAVVLYEIEGTGSSINKWVNFDEPLISEEGWYDKNKNRSASLLYTEGNSFGDHYSEELHRNFAELLEELSNPNASSEISPDDSI